MLDSKNEKTEKVSPPKWLQREYDFFSRIRTKAHAPQYVYRLRNHANPAASSTVHHIVPGIREFLPPPPRERAEAYLDIAAWYALGLDNPRLRFGKPLPRVWAPGQGNIGWTFAQAARMGILTAEQAESSLALACQFADRKQMMQRLKPMVIRLAREGAPVNWVWLLRDVDRWKFRNDVVAEWIRSFADPDREIYPYPQS